MTSAASLSGFVNVSGNPKLDRLNDAIERVMAEKAVARSSSPVPLPDTDPAPDPDWTMEIA